MNILGIDPGPRYTGVATKMGDVYETIELQDNHRGAWMYVLMTKWDAVVCENFLAVQISTYGLTTVRIIGGVEALCLANNIPYYVQQNVQRDRFKQQAYDMIKAAKGRVVRDHEQDALAHVLAWEAHH